MKVLHWAIILVIILLPVSIVCRVNTNAKFSSLKDEVRIISMDIAVANTTANRKNDYTDIKCKNSVIYCDPPYLDSQRNYYDCDFNHNNFYNWCRVMSKDNKIFISETQMPNDFKVVWEKPYKRALANQTKAIKTVEKLFTL